jgi:hypothetical protein
MITQLVQEEQTGGKESLYEKSDRKILKQS